MQLLGACDRALHPLRAVRQDDLRPIGLEEVAALHAHRLRHRENRAVAARRRHRGDTDARVAARRLDQRRPRRNLAVLFRLLDHRDRNAILD